MTSLVGDRALAWSFMTSLPVSALPERHLEEHQMDAASTAPGVRPRRVPLRRPGFRDSADRVVVGGSGGQAEDPLRIAMLAPPWISVPAPGYGGVESVVSTLTEALVRRGHDVTLFCAPGSVRARPSSRF